MQIVLSDKIQMHSNASVKVKTRKLHQLLIYFVTFDFNILALKDQLNVKSCKLFFAFSKHFDNQRKYIGNQKKSRSKRS